MRPGGGGDGTFDHGMGVRVRVVRCALGARLLEYDQSLAHLGHCRRSAPTGSCDRKKEVGDGLDKSYKMPPPGKYAIFLKSEN